MAKEMTLKFNMANALKDFKQLNVYSENLNINLNTEINRLQDARTELTEKLLLQKRGSDAYKNINIQISDINKNLKVTTNELGDVVEISEAFEDVISAPTNALAQSVSKIPLIGGALSTVFTQPLAKINDMNKSMSKFNESFRVVNQKGGGLKFLITDMFTSFNKNAKLFSANMLSSVKAISAGLLTNIGPAFAALIPVIGTVVVSLAPIIAGVLAIAAVVYTLKKVWDFNVGGIQKHVFGLIGIFRDGLGRSVLKFQQILQKLGPVFSTVFKIIFPILKGITVALFAITDAFFSALAPLADTLGEIFKPFEQMLGDGKGIVSLFKTMGQVIGAVISIALIPLKILAGTIKLIMTGLKLLKGESAGVKSPTEGIKGGTSPFGRPVTAITSGTQRTTNNNPSITINTSREVSSQGAKDFSNTLVGILGTQAKVA